jgi:hypothetical protein
VWGFLLVYFDEQPPSCIAAFHFCFFFFFPFIFVSIFDGYCWKRLYWYFHGKFSVGVICQGTKHIVWLLDSRSSLAATIFVARVSTCIPCK